MNHRALLQLVRVTCDHWHDYNQYSQKELLSALFWLADVVVDDLQARSDRNEFEKAISEVQLIQDFSEDALQGGDLHIALGNISECVTRAVPLPDE